MNWNDWLVESEASIRLGFFFGTFVIIAIWEMLSPRRLLTVSKSIRWASNLSLVFLNTIVSRLLFPAAAVGVAIVADEQNWGGC